MGNGGTSGSVHASTSQRQRKPFLQFAPTLCNVHVLLKLILPKEGTDNVPAQYTVCDQSAQWAEEVFINMKITGDSGK